MYVTREGTRGVRWWNFLGLGLFVAFLVWELIGETPRLGSLVFWLLCALGLAGVALMPRDLRFHRGQGAEQERM